MRVEVLNLSKCSKFEEGQREQASQVQPDAALETQLPLHTCPSPIN